MPQSLDRVKRRIKSVESTRKVTNSMKLVSSVKVRKISKQIDAQREFYNALLKVLSNAFNFESLPENNIALISKNNSNKKLLVVITSNMGLCGGYNINVLKYLESIKDKDDDILIIGEKGKLRVKSINLDFVDLCKNFDLNQAKKLVNFLIEKYVNKEYKEIDLVYAKYKNSIAYIPSTFKILPLDINTTETKKAEPIYEDSKEDVINTLIPLYLNSVVYNEINSALLSEQSARRNAMDNADKNAQELVDQLRLEYNKARQTAITQEITEVVNGGNAVN